MVMVCGSQRRSSAECASLSRSQVLARTRDTGINGHASILTDDFVEAASQAGWHARQAALAAGYPVVFVDAAGRCVEEWPDGKRFEIRRTLHNRRNHTVSCCGNWRRTPRKVATLTLVAGPNGAGKSTLTASIAFEGPTSVVDQPPLPGPLMPNSHSAQRSLPPVKPWCAAASCLQTGRALFWRALSPAMAPSRACVRQGEPTIEHI